MFIDCLYRAPPACFRTVENCWILNSGRRLCACRGRTECELGSWRQLAPVNKPTGILSEGTREKRSAARRERESKPVANLFYLRRHTHTTVLITCLPSSVTPMTHTQTDTGPQTRSCEDIGYTSLILNAKLLFFIKSQSLLVLAES